MTDVAALRRSLDEMERIQRVIGGIGRREDDRRAQDLIDCRRALAAQLTLVAEQGAAVFGARDPALEREFRGRFSAMRSGMAYLQASWPAVKVRDDKSGGYIRAAEAQRRIDVDFLTWIRAAVSKGEQAT